MRAQVVSIRFVLCCAAVLCVVFLSARLLISSENARPIASLTAHERMNLPGSTQVTLNSGQTTTLAALRAEHEARLQRFTKAAMLGKAVAAKVVAHPVNNPVSKSPAMANRTGPQGAPTGKGTAISKTSLKAGPDIPPLPVLVPFHMPAPPMGRPLPKDYVDFCKAANPSVCTYLPAVSLGFSAGASFAVDTDWLIFDKSTCDYSGGVLASDASGSACLFYYPYSVTVDFIPTGPLTSAVSCDSPFTYVVDPRGAIQVSYPTVLGPHGGEKFLYDYGVAKSCVIQVWIQPGK
jgi:hypothetical protein